MKFLVEIQPGTRGNGGSHDGGWCLRVIDGGWIKEDRERMRSEGREEK